MKKIALFTGCLFFAFLSHAQVSTVQFAVKIPLPDSSSKSVYLAGSFNCWHAGDSLYRMQKEKDGLYRIVIPVFSNHPYEYKYTLGSWDRVETALNDSDISNRRFYASGQLAIYDTVSKFRDPAPRETKISPQMAKVNAMKDSALARMQGDLEGLKTLFGPFIENLLQDTPDPSVTKRIHKKARKKIGTIYDHLARLFEDVFAMLSPEQKKKIRELMQKRAKDEDIINRVGNALEEVMK